MSTLCMCEVREMNKLVMPYLFFFLTSVSIILYRIHQLSEAYCVSRDGWMNGHCWCLMSSSEEGEEN
jgi:hypothetical protein